MLSQKLQKDLMNAYAAVHEEKRGHAAGDSDVEKQASQLASDVRYKAKGKVKEGASDEEKKKIFLQILGASPAPSAVKAMAKTKLLGEEVVNEMRFDDGKEGTKKRLKALEKKRGMKMPNHPQFKTEEKAPRMQKGAMAYDGPNKPASFPRCSLFFGCVFLAYWSDTLGKMEKYHGKSEPQSPFYNRKLKKNYEKLRTTKTWSKPWPKIWSKTWPKIWSKY